MKRLRTLLPSAALLAAFAALLLLPQQTSAAVTDGLRLSLSVLVPSLFPFFICVNLAANLGLTGWLARLLAPLFRRVFRTSGAGGSAWLFGAVGGYPSGAQSVAVLYQAGQLSAQEADYLLRFCNNAGPAFLFGVAGQVLGLGLPWCLLLWAIHLVSALAVGLLFRPSGAPRGLPQAAHPSPAVKSGAFVDAVRAAGQSVLQVTLFVTAFFVLSRLCTLAAQVFLPPAACTLLSGLLELSGGIAALGTLALPLVWKLAAASFFLGFGGLCVWMQTKAVLASAGLSGRGILPAKLLQGALAAALTLLAARLLPPDAVPAMQRTYHLPFWGVNAAVCAGFCLCFLKLRLDISRASLYNRRKRAKER